MKLSQCYFYFGEVIIKNKLLRLIGQKPFAWATKNNISTATINGILNGRIPRPKTIALICEKAGISVEEFLAFDDSDIEQKIELLFFKSEASYSKKIRGNLSDNKLDIPPKFFGEIDVESSKSLILVKVAINSISQIKINDLVLADTNFDSAKLNGIFLAQIGIIPPMFLSFVTEGNILSISSDNTLYPTLNIKIDSEEFSTIKILAKAKCHTSFLD
jgi:hypothetical protein